MTAKEALALAVAEHKKWLADNSTGTRLDLSEANLTRADLTLANLTGAYLMGADLTLADLTLVGLMGAIGLTKETP